MELILFGALAEAIFGALFGILGEDLAQRRSLAGLRERLRGEAPELVALRRALWSAYQRFDAKYPELTHALFDEIFLKSPELAAELAKLLTLYRQPDIQQIQQLWYKQLGTKARDSIQKPLEYFISELELAIGDQKDLFVFVNGRTAQSTKRILAQIEADTRPVESPIKPPPFMVDKVENFVERPNEYEEIIQYLLDENNQTVAISAALQGAGGFGKTTLAQAICYDSRVQQAFPDGILWVTIGENSSSVLLGLNKLYKELTGDSPPFIDEQGGTLSLRDALNSRRCLIVVDDVWNSVHLSPFLADVPGCVTLITTRIRQVVPQNARLVTVDAMRTTEATSLLNAGLPSGEETLLTSLAIRLGEWPLLLKLANRVLFEYVNHNKLTKALAIAELEQEYDEFGLTTFDADDPQERNQAVAASMSVSLRLLQADKLYGSAVVNELARFSELAVFPEDVAVRLKTIALLWRETGQMTEAATKKLCRRLADLSLVLKYDLQEKTILLHDVTRQYLIDTVKSTEPELFLSWHTHLLAGYRRICDGVWSKMENDGYFYHNHIRHLSEAGHQEEIEELFLDFYWLKAKLEATNITALINDFEYRQDKEQHSISSLLQNALRLSAYILAEDPQQLASQLLGRLSSLQSRNWAKLLNAASTWHKTHWLRPVQPNLTPPGGPLIYTLGGHTAGINPLLLHPDSRRLISSSHDHTIKVWDLDSGQLHHSLEAHTSGVDQLLLHPDGRRLISACSSRDHTIKVWDLDSGQLHHSLEAHTSGVNQLLLHPDGHRLISACLSSRSDYTIKVWDLDSGQLRHSLEAHTDGVSRLLLHPDGHRLISACSNSRISRDHTIKVWDLDSGQLRHSLEAHTDGVDQLLLHPDGHRLISACSNSSRLISRDHTIKVWDLDSGQLRHSLEAHTDGADWLLLHPDGRRLISACRSRYSNRDHTIKVWDLDSGQLHHSLEAHTSGVDWLLLHPDGHRLISACLSSSLSSSSRSDYTIKVWDLDSGQLHHSLEAHTDGADWLLLHPDGHRLISACSSSSSSDYTIKVWDLDSAQLHHSLEAHTDGADQLLLHPDGRRLISACSSRDHTIKVWDLDSGQLRHSLETHTDGVKQLLLHPDGHRLISACSSRDHTIKVWDLDSGQLHHSLEAHTSGVDQLLLHPDGRRLISACSSRDHTIKVWNLDSAQLHHSLEAHTSGVNQLLLHPDGHRLISACRSSSSDYTIKVWDLDSGQLRHSLEAHTDGVSRLLLHPDGHRLISACSNSSRSRSDHTIKVWDLDSGQLRHSLEAHTDDVDQLLLHPDGRRLISSSHDRTIKVWNLDSGQLHHSLEAHTSGVDQLLLHPDGRRLISACSSSSSRDHTIKVWDLDSGQLHHSLEAHTSGVDWLLLHPDGRRLISACSSSSLISLDHTIKVWDLDSAQLHHSLEAHTDGVSRLLLHPDGRRLISACRSSSVFSRSSDYTIKVWDLDSAQLHHSLEAHTDGVNQLLLHPDGHRLISACSSSSLFSRSSDYTIKVWDLDSGQLRHSLETHSISVSFLVVQQNNEEAMVTTAGDRLHLWNIKNGHLEAQFFADAPILSCRVVSDSLIVAGDALGRVHFLQLIKPGASSQN